MNIDDLDEGDILEGVVLETFRTKGVGSRPGRKIRVRLVSEPAKDMFVAFPIKLREKTPIGTRFLANVRVCQSHLQDGKRSRKYLYAYAKSIKLVG
jgi:hypothetical protein